MPLTEITCKNAKPAINTRRIFDERGLYLEITPNGRKYWRLKYRIAGKEKRLAVGVYPEVSLKLAREKRDTARVAIREGVDPSAEKKAARLAQSIAGRDSFSAIATEWHENRRNLWTPRYAEYVIRRLEADLIPALGAVPIKDITAPQLLTALRRIESRDALDLAHRMLQTVGQIFSYAIATGRTDRNVAADLKGALKPAKKTNYARLSESELPEFLEKLEHYDGERQTKIGVKLLLFTFVRTVELRRATWAEIDFEKAEWRIPAARMKMREEHIVPLSTQAVALFREQQLLTGRQEYAFPNRNKPNAVMSENTILYALYRMGYHSRATAHGFRATASTILNENGFRSDFIERQLAHGDRNKVRATYNHAQYLRERAEMMQWWADFIVSISAKKRSGKA